MARIGYNARAVDGDVASPSALGCRRSARQRSDSSEATVNDEPQLAPACDRRHLKSTVLRANEMDGALHHGRLTPMIQPLRHDNHTVGALLGVSGTS